MITLYIAAKLLHLIALGWGLGGSTVSAILMKRTEKDPSLIQQVARFHETLSKVVWGGIILLIISGILLAISPEASFTPYALGLKHLLVVVVVFDGLYFTFRGMPQMRRLAPKIGPPGKEYRKAYSHMKKVGILSMLSWYAIVVISAIF